MDTERMSDEELKAENERLWQKMVNGTETAEDKARRLAVLNEQSARRSAAFTAEREAETDEEREARISASDKAQAEAEERQAEAHRRFEETLVYSPVDDSKDHDEDSCISY